MSGSAEDAPEGLQSSQGGGPARGAGWRALRRTRMERFRPDFERLRSTLRRTELMGSVVELFFTALAGVGRMQLGGSEAQPAKRQAEQKPKRAGDPPIVDPPGRVDPQRNDR